MRRSIRQDDTPADHDSFLDIVANIVGILIILVMVAGVRAKNAPVTVEMDEEIQATMVSLESNRAVANSIRGDIGKTEQQIEALKREQAIRAAERAQLATLVAAWEHRLDERRGRLDTGEHDAFDLGLQLSDAQLRLEQAEQRRMAVESIEIPSETIENRPTPLSQTVDTDEAHFQLRGGRIVFIELERLLQEFRDDASRKKDRLLSQNELTETIGPRGGFRMKYTLVRHDPSMEDFAAGHGRTQIVLKQWTLIPVSGQLGESIDEALAAGSRFDSALSRFRPGTTTVTLWAYQDSFESFRRIKEELYDRGFTLAARPLPMGASIGGSPQGSKSAAQ